MINNEESILEDNSGRLLDLSLFDSAYGKEIRLLADGMKSSVYLTKDEKKAENEEKVTNKKKKKLVNSNQLQTDVEFGSWAYKVQNTRYQSNNTVRNYHTILSV